MPAALRSDPVTRPTADMRAVMANADVGDDDFGEDPTDNRLEATVAAMEFVDACLGTLVDACAEVGAILLVTADHGNADEMYELDKKGAPILVDGVRKPRTSHSLNPVPFVLVDPTHAWQLDCPPLTKDGGPGIAQIGGTLLTLFGVPLPADYLPPLVRRAPVEPA
jgi:2,3-bisphosphoglycerate-independent phosphoglycerate mutase